MKIDWTDLSMDPKWYELSTGKLVEKPAEDAEGAFLQIRPYPAELAKVVVRDEGILIDGKTQKNIFLYCLVGWHGITGADDQALPLTDDVKEKVYTFKLGGIPDFVVVKSRQFQERKKALEKN